MNESVKALNDAIEVADLFWAAYDNKDKSTICWKLFDVLVVLTKTSPGLAAHKVEECYFPTSEVTIKLDEKADKKAGFYDGNRLSKEYKKLHDRLSEVEGRLAEIAVKAGKNVIPALHKDESSGGQRKQANYRIIAKPIDERKIASTGVVDSEPESHDISYYIESTPKLPIWGRWLQHLNIEKYRWPIIIFTASPMFLGVFCCVAFALLINGIGLSWVGKFISFGIIYIAAFMAFFRYFITAIENNIALLPNWMLPLKLESAVIQYELNKPGTEKKRIKEISVKVYAAKCPICGHRIIIKSQGLPFKKRLVGVCDLNPTEHRYSFDFTTLKGIKLC